MTYLTEAERLERKRLASKRYRSKEEVKLKKKIFVHTIEKEKKKENLF